MLIKFILIICLIFAVNGAYALDFDEEIHLKGDGQLVCRTDAKIAQDRIAASGSQSYHRVVNLDTENKTVSLKSIYSLNVSDRTKLNVNSINNRSLNAAPVETKRNQYPASSGNELNPAVNMGDSNALDYEYLPIYSRSLRVKSSISKRFDLVYNNSEDLSKNQYGIMMVNPNYLQYGSVVTGADHFSANNSINFCGGKVITKYKMSGSGLLKGSLIERDAMGRPRNIAETQIRDSNFSISSGLKNEAKLEKNLEDRVSLSEKVDKVGIGSKKEIEANQTADINDKYIQETIFGNLSLDGSEVPATFDLYGGDIDITDSEVEGKFELSGSETESSDATAKKTDDNQTAAGTQDDAFNLSGVKANLTDGDQKAAGSQDDGLNPINEKLNKDDSDQKAGGTQVDRLKSTGEKINLTDDNSKNEIKTNNLLKLGELTKNTLGGTIIPGSAFGAAINSTYKSPNAMITASSWRTAYIGSFRPDSKKEKIVSKGAKYNVSLIKGIYVITENKTGLKQRYLKIGSSDGTIKIRATPPGARFDIYEAVAN